MRASFLVASAVAVLCASAAPSAQAYCRSTTCTGDCPRDIDGCKTSGEKLFWTSSCVGFSLQRDGSVNIPMKYIREVAQRSFTAWTDLECPDGLATMAFSELDEAACHRTEYNEGAPNANIILFQDNKWDYGGVDNTLAKTTVTFDAETGEIFDADIEMNHAYNNFTISETIIDYDLESVLTHEIGHFMGLDHTPDFSATMYAGYEPGTIEQRTPEEDDVLATCEAYPPSRSASCDPTPRGGFGSECGGAATPEDGDAAAGCAAAPARPALRGWITLGAALTPLLFLARRRRRTPSFPTRAT